MFPMPRHPGHCIPDGVALQVTKHSRMKLDIERQVASAEPGLPDTRTLASWAGAALDGSGIERAELVVRIVDEAESQALNQRYRGKDRPTNVLSFPFEAPPGLPAEIAAPCLGDLVICAPVVRQEATRQHKALDAHWAHIVVHGVLHLLGHDHQNDAEAAEMEARERDILKRLGYPDPYRTEPTENDDKRPSL